ncbi:glycosyltransferase family 4 protein [Croceicoccus naphthovorans]|uniref:GDP-mannose-dependent alpha-mannosyltransferase n=1 Tax=Croceicoccus naphthovorans TaxID=1348774 RepID=A0A0G3XJD1_9SPHN|nr:glycosyltransferase family 1 protein [Croceicoccus naphthovorans]AKM10488.1 GDP-mannose-dependent alpha-mannosyltransferase [Croceicoccus naphthovorans]MBB3988668.1 glycosyltransferase involved in cell wall biosynthesis [Croceicoccus naphthovorans]
MNLHSSLFDPPFPQRIALATDAWKPQVNGVVRTLEETVSRLAWRGHEVMPITPDQFASLPMPFYREIRLALAPKRAIGRKLAAFSPEIVHIATEGPIGWATRNWCLKHGVPFTTAFHTRFPDYAAVRTGLSAERFWPLMQRFHAPSRAVLAATPSLRHELVGRGIGPIVPWSRGIDAALFNADVVPDARIRALRDEGRGPVLLYVGRLAPEKGLDDFLRCDHPGSKVVVGDGPALAALKAKYPQASFTGRLTGKALASAYAAADCFVFPSRSDTFGLVMVEALACGVPVAGFPVQGPIDIVGPVGRGGMNEQLNPIGAVDEDLNAAIARALACNRADCARYGAEFSWDAATDQFVAALAGALEGEPVAA